MSKIPIENIYYLLCYAWDNLVEKERVAVSVDREDTPLDLLARILISGSKVLLKRGIDHNYTEVTEEVSGIKGKLLFSRTLKSGLLSKQRTVCLYDEFSSDILSNRIWITTLRQLLRVPLLHKDLKKEMAVLLNMLPQVTPLRISLSCFDQVRLHRNNRLYGFILNVCRLIHEQLLPSETEGTYQFVDFTRDEKKMAQLFEAFVRNFYRLEQRKYSVGREHLKWQFYSRNENDIQYLPRMETDISLENDKEKIIIDTKYYNETLSRYYDTEKIHSTNLYQLFSYLMNPRDKSDKARKATGILLYPTIEKEYNFEYRYEEHPIFIRTVNLNAHWTEIATRLKTIISV